MKTKTSTWIIPGLFFLLAATLNICGKYAGNEALAAHVKPALLPLLALTTLAAAGSLEPKEMKLLILAQLLGCTGDVFLIFNGFLPFIGGMGAFLLGHICYITLFGGRSWKGLGLKTWIPTLVVIGALVAGLISVLGVEGDLLVPMIIYGTVLMLLIFSGLAGVVREGGCAWWLILFGAVLFTFSDSLIALDTFSEKPMGWVAGTIMLTYLAAQSLLAWGAVKLSAE